MMNDHDSDRILQLRGRVRSMFYLMDEPVTTLTIQLDGESITARAYGQRGLDLRALPRGATICTTLQDGQQECAQIIAFTVIRVDQLC